MKKGAPLAPPNLRSPPPAAPAIPTGRSRAGKTLGSDLRKGKLTLPILHLLQTSSEADRHRFSEIILNGDDDAILALADRAIAAGAVKSAIATGRKMLREVATQLEVVPPNKYRDALTGLVTTLDAMIGQFGE